jgi:hypothetical protein
MNAAQSLIHEENDDVRITQWSLHPGGATG